MTDRAFDEDAVAAAWNRNAAVWIEEVRDGMDLYRALYTFPAFLDFMPAIDGRRCIDLGCGEGANTRRFARRGGEMTGIDVSERMIARARECEAAEPLGITYEVSSFSDLSAIGDESFDCALSTMALMDGPDFPAAMRSAHRVLKPGGILCFSILHPCFITPELKWLQDESGTHLGLRIGRYFETAPFVECLRFKRPVSNPVTPFEIPRFPRTLADYLNAVIEASLRIDRIEEPRPSEEVSREHDWLMRWRQHAPLVLFVSASKPV
jgi:ubiquinone/menaquinone biosynthesis C-methylase UbiE